MPSGRSVGLTSNSKKVVKTFIWLEKYAFWSLLGPNFCSPKMIKDVIGFKIMPSGRSVVRSLGQTSVPKRS